MRRDEMPEEIADGAITEAKLADGAVTEAKLGHYAVTEDKLSPGSVNYGHLAFDLVKTGVKTLGPHTAVEELVLANIGTAQLSALFFADVIPSNPVGSGSGSVEASIVYRQDVGSFLPNIGIRLVNHGSATIGVSWSVRALKGLNLGAT